MSFNYYSVPDDIRSYIDSRFEAYGLDPQLAYDHLIPFEVKIQGAEVVEEFISNKHISHIYPTSHYPEIARDLDNVFLEDPRWNISRSDAIATPDEVFRAEMDNRMDAFDGDYNDDGILDAIDGLI